ncbi:MAG: HigA family addiction module antidote protein [Endomicrobium sp.]|jgi:addiction module HigA family antidote|nr:HigA family addiction module antidote protein [Endomicrobium sp.]
MAREPRKILKNDFMKAKALSSYKLARETKMPDTRVHGILKGKRKITYDTALKFAKYFGNSAEFWIGIQNECDLRKERVAIKELLSQIRPLKIAS